MLRYILPKRAIGFLQHHCNPLHVFCRLKCRGISKDTAQSLCDKYEKWLYNLFL